MNDCELAPIPVAELLRKGSLFYLLLFGAALLWTALAGRSLRYWPPSEAGSEAESAFGLGLGLVAGALVIALSHALTQQTAWGARLARWLGALLGPLTDDALRRCASPGPRGYRRCRARHGESGQRPRHRQGRLLDARGEGHGSLPQ